MASKDRDVLAEFDGIVAYLEGLAQEHQNPGWGQDANLKRLAGESAAFRNVAQNIVELHAEYARGVTHEDRLRAAGMLPDSGSQSEIEELRRQLAEARAASNG